MNKDTRFRLAVSAAELALTAICTVIALTLSLYTTPTKIAGSFAAVFILTIVVWKFPKSFYAEAMAFHFFAAPLGSVINLYYYVDPYDRVVHYASGVVLAAAGSIMIDYIFKKRGIRDDKAVKLLFVFFFSAACAGFWEIYEFTADIILGGNMQGSNTNTMGDIVSGVLGALTYTVVSWLVIRKRSP